MSLTGTMSELEAQVGAPEAVDGDGQFDNLPPARTIAVVEDERVVGTPVGLPGAQADAVLGERSKLKCHLPGGGPAFLSLGPFAFSLAQLSRSHQAQSIK